jgi:ribosomal protein S18 acetylase RimI-like enzyme
VSASAVELRRATPADAPAVADLYLASRADALPYLRRVHTDEETRAWIGRLVAGRGEVWLAIVGGRIVGFLRVEGEDLDQLYLDPGFYRRGIGSALVEKAKTLSPEGLHLYAFQRNARARAFYEAHGFTIFDLNDGSRNEEREPDLQYEWNGVLTRRQGAGETPKA